MIKQNSHFLKVVQHYLHLLQYTNMIMSTSFDAESEESHITKNNVHKKWAAQIRKARSEDIKVMKSECVEGIS